eukprot:CAMPEP_0174856432 /NCGR_PEP_ID=MMETSP1114-20130205/35908_1 /TAXON_ID=312471 /ORGANISM="Neobodo designis, Strain CCAP 1951/1" /LENGTH=180 /DNA_ID=CAMNT_0016091229 /DNA_START=111 /DNA_END=654 /DNA_ORIENTATION=+
MERQSHCIHSHDVAAKLAKVMTAETTEPALETSAAETARSEFRPLTQRSQKEPLGTARCGPLWQPRTVRPFGDCRCCWFDQHQRRWKDAWLLPLARHLARGRRRAPRDDWNGANGETIASHKLQTASVENFPSEPAASVASSKCPTSCSVLASTKTRCRTDYIGGPHRGRLENTHPLRTL